MRKLACFPSSHLPDFMKLDLEVGLPSANPLVKALDDVAQMTSQLSFGKAWQIGPSCLPVGVVRAILSGMGFVVERLNDEICYSLFARRQTLLGVAQSLVILQELAEAFLGECQVQRGRPIANPPLPEQGVSELVLVDSQTSETLLFVRSRNAVDAGRIEDFIATCRRLMPSQIEVNVSGPRVEWAPAKNGMDLSRPFALKSRRL